MHVMTITRCAVAVFAALALASCTSDAQPRPAVSPAPPTTSPQAADPYEVYLQIAPSGTPKLSREDAQTRAMLGCGTDWAPGTVDAALRQAYGERLC